MRRLHRYEGLTLVLVQHDMGMLVVDGATLDALVDHARANTDGGPEINGSIQTFVTALLDEDLIEDVEEVDDLDRHDAVAGDGERRPFSPPQVQRFDDLQELLLLDPIHDVSDQGWPHTPPA